MTVKVSDLKIDNAAGGSFKQLFSLPNVRKKTLTIYLTWFTNFLIYYGISLNTARLAGNAHLNLFLFGAVEIPANLMGMYLLDKVGRRWEIGGTCACVGLFSSISVVVILFDGNPNIVTALAVLGKACITASFSGVYLYSAEIFPTPVRNIGLGTSSIVGRVSAMLAPFAGGALGDVWEPLPSLVFAVFASLNAALVLLLMPETMNTILPETVEQAEAFGKKTPAVVEVTNKLLFTIVIDTAAAKDRFAPKKHNSFGNLSVFQPTPACNEYNDKENAVYIEELDCNATTTTTAAA